MDKFLLSSNLNLNAKSVNDADAFVGVDNFPNIDLYNPENLDFIGDMDGDGSPDYYLTDSIRIENGVFQNITLFILFVLFV